MSKNHSKQKQDRPSWRWQGHGVFAYTHDADAARYVAQCRQREMDKVRAKLAIVAKRETRIEQVVA